MKLHEHERAKPNMAGLTSPVQHAEMRILLAGRWPALKPLPVFKYETDVYRASIDFDKLRGEWVCRKTSLPSNNVQELRGGLTEIILALCRGQAEVFTERGAEEPQEQESEKEASRRLQAILEWREKYENGALYSGLQDYLSESEQEEIDESVRLTLTARQLQFTPKNVAHVFDALSRAGGKLATLVETAQRKKAGRGVDLQANAEGATPGAERDVSNEAIHPTRERRLRMRITPASRAYLELGGGNGGVVLNMSEIGLAIAATEPLVVNDYFPCIRLQLPNSGQSIELSVQIVWLEESKKSAGLRFIDLTAEARNQISNWIASEKPASEFACLTPAPVQSLIPATLEGFREESTGTVLPEPGQSSSPERITLIESQASKIVTSETLDTNSPSFVEHLQEKVHCHIPVARFGLQVRTDKTETSADRTQNSPSRLYPLEISGLQVAAVLLLFTVISLAAALTVGRRPLAERLGDTQKSLPGVDAVSPPLLRSSETTLRASTPPAANTFLAPAANPQAKATAGSRSKNPSTQSLNARPENSAAHMGPIVSSAAIATRSSSGPDNLKAHPERKGSTVLIARNAPAPANIEPTPSFSAVAPISGASANPVPRTVTHPAPHLSSPSTILVTGPDDGRKPFRLTLPEEPIAASSSFAMTSQLSVLVSPEPGPTSTHHPARLQAGELVSFVWPRYPRPGDRHRSSETVKVRTTIGEFGQVLDVKHVSGSVSLLPAAMSAIRQWRYKPTLLNMKPVQAQQDVTIEFRTSQHWTRAPTRHPSHN